MAGSRNDVKAVRRQRVPARLSDGQPRILAPLSPSTVPTPPQPGFHSTRDVVGELATAVRARGLRFGVYYSGGLDWTFNDRPIGAFSDLLAAQPRGDYVEYAEAHVRELIDRYHPSVLW